MGQQERVVSRQKWSGKEFLFLSPPKRARNQLAMAVFVLSTFSFFYPSISNQSPIFPPPRDDGLGRCGGEKNSRRQTSARGREIFSDEKTVEIVVIFTRA